MRNPFTPPASEVADVASEKKPPSRLRTAMLVVAFSIASLALAWFVVPVIASGIAVHSGVPGSETPPALLALDLSLSFAVFFLGCYLAASLSRGHSAAAAAGVGAIGWVVYFGEVGGVAGMLNSQFPFWYEFFPSHILAAIFGYLLARRRES